MKTIYEWTGEYRPPKKGEWYLHGGKPCQAIEDWALPRWILSPRQEEAKDE